MVLPVFPTHGIKLLFHERQLGLVEHDHYLAGTTAWDEVWLKLQENRSQAAGSVAVKQGFCKWRRVGGVVGTELHIGNAAPGLCEFVRSGTGKVVIVGPVNLLEGDLRGAFPLLISVKAV